MLKYKLNGSNATPSAANLALVKFEKFDSHLSKHCKLIQDYNDFSIYVKE